jgi:hypothetical protein
VKFAEIRGQDTGVVRFAKERDAEVAISKLIRARLYLILLMFYVFAELMDGSRFDGRQVDCSFF